jgi:raffinose/stachyose/melibiose transport system permease protein
MTRYRWRTGALEGVMILIGIVFLFPIYVMVNLSVRGPGDSSFAHVPTANPTFDNFVEAWNESDMARALVNSFVITVVSVLLIVFLGALAAYGIARATQAWSTAAFYVFLLGLLVPFQLTMVPMYQNFARLDAIGSPLTLIVIYVGFRMPFTVFLYTSFLRLQPRDYEEAASIDGAGPLRRFWSVAFPLMRPVTGSVVILTGLYVWNDFLAPLLYLGGSDYQTVPLEVYSFVSDNATRWPLVFAALIISTVPILIAYFFLQKSLIQGFESGVKG